MKYIEVEDREKVRVVTVSTDNPLNPLTIEILREVGTAVTGSNLPVVLNGKGRAFSAGANIKDFTKMTPQTAYHFATEGHDIMNSIASADVPVIAAIHGFALGGGFELALSCDFRISTPDAKLGLPEITLGILPGFGGTQRLTAIAGEGNALDLISTGRSISGQEALSMGIVKMVDKDYMGESLKFAQELSEKPPVALSLIKKLVRQAPGEKYEEEKESFGKVFETEDSREGFEAFLNKRKPKFTGK